MGPAGGCLEHEEISYDFWLTFTVYACENQLRLK